MIRVSEPDIGKEELNNVIEAVKSGFISGTHGKFLREFESEFAKYCGVKYGVTTSSGTTALHLAMESIDLKKGDEVIIPACTNIATALAVVYAGAKPIVVDIETDTWNMSVNKVKDSITSRTKAILPVHIYGHPVDMEEIIDIAEKQNIWIVEDCAEAHGAEYKNKKVGGLGDIGCFSFYANKIITTGEGGMIVTDNKKVAELSANLKDLAFDKKRRFRHERLGFNYRMTNVQAAIGLAQLKKIDSIVAKKRKMAEAYNNLLKDIEGITLPVEKPWAKNVYWMYSILIKKSFGINRETLRNKLSDKGIETRIMFIPMHQQPALRNIGYYKSDKHPVSERIGREGLYLPSGTTLEDKEIQFVCEAIKDIKNETK